MSNDAQQAPDFGSVKARLAEIADAVNDEGLSLDDALDMYEEAVALGLQASDLLETGISAPEDVDEAAGQGADSSQADQLGQADPASAAPSEDE